MTSRAATTALESKLKALALALRKKTQKKMFHDTKTESGALERPDLRAIAGFHSGRPLRWKLETVAWPGLFVCVVPLTILYGRHCDGCTCTALAAAPPLEVLQIGKLL